MGIKDNSDSRSFIKKDIGDERDRITGKSRVYDKQAADAGKNRREIDAELSGRRVPSGSMKNTSTASSILLDALRDKNAAGGMSDEAVAAKNAAENHMANLREVEEETQDMRRRQGFKKTLNTLQNAITPGKYAKGGRVTGFKGYGKAKKV